MRIPHIALVGFLLTAFCASFCPMSVGVAEMDHHSEGGMHATHEHKGASHETQTACEYCEKHDLAEIALFENTPLFKGSSFAVILPIRIVNPFTEYHHVTSEPWPYLAIAGPPLDTSMISTVVLRT